jgi:hypothetical protein
MILNVVLRVRQLVQSLLMRPAATQSLALRLVARPGFLQTT